MTTRFTALIPLVLVACAPHYEWVETPAAEREAEPAAEPAPANATRPDMAGPRTSQDLACEGSTSATRAHARRSRFRSVEGFNTRGCVRPGPWKTAD